MTGLEDLELLDRGRHIARALAAVLPPDFGRAAPILTASLGPVLDSTEDNGMSVFEYLPHSYYVADYGLEHFEAAMQFQYQLTQRFTAEFSIRPYLQRYPEASLERLHSWVEDPSAHVRRLVSEGTRTRLPWAGRLPQFQRDPQPVLALLERLRDDPSLYVRRSVANNLNDISKDNPDAALAVCERWMQDASDQRRWIVEHALRVQIKRGDARALAVLGFGGPQRLDVAGRCTPRRARIGGSVLLEAELHHAGRKPLRAVADFVVHFVKANGTTAPKVFKGSELELGPDEHAQVRKTISLRQHTTRTHYAGVHRVQLRVNGRDYPLGSFTLA